MIRVQLPLIPLPAGATPFNIPLSADQQREARRVNDARIKPDEVSCRQWNQLSDQRKADLMWAAQQECNHLRNGQATHGPLPPGLRALRSPVPLDPRSVVVGIMQYAAITPEEHTFDQLVNAYILNRSLTVVYHDEQLLHDLIDLLNYHCCEALEDDDPADGYEFDDLMASNWETLEDVIAHAPLHPTKQLRSTAQANEPHPPEAEALQLTITPQLLADLGYSPDHFNQLREAHRQGHLLPALLISLIHTLELPC